jgi:gamma-glutamyltranspeptidase/glutathione hydrolase
VQDILIPEEGPAMVRPYAYGVIVLALAGSAFGQGAQTPAPRPLPTRPAGSIVGQWHASGSNGAVVAGGAEAVEAGLSILRAGGNAVDAAVATILAQSVTDADQFCFGGEVPILIYDAHDKVVEVLAGQGAAPRLATREHFAERGGIPARGIEAAAVPAAPDALLTALARHGTKSFSEVAAPALRILDRGEHSWHADLARTIRRLIEAEAGAGDRKRGLRLAADAFYRGPTARAIDAWSLASGGLIRYADLAAHVTRIEEPVTAEYRGYVVAKCGPWTQGPALLEALEILDGYDLARMGHNRADAIHLAIEALKLAFADRDVFYADPLFEDVPLKELLSTSYAAKRRALISLTQAGLTQRPGDPRGNLALLSEPLARRGLGGVANDTTTCLVADGQGNVVAATPSGWSGVLAGDTGVWLGSRLQSFNIWKGHPNCIEPGKRPRITLTPTIVLKEGRPTFAVSVAGGDAQDQVTLQMLMNVVDFGQAPADAVTAPRFLTGHFLGSFRQAPPKLGFVEISDGIGTEVIMDLLSRGHILSLKRPPLACPSVLRLDPRTSRLDVAGDPKARRHAAAY